MDRISAFQAVVRLYDLGSFSEVAAELRVGQSTVSKWLASFEEELRVSLVQRTTRSVVFTDPGEQFVRDARRLLEAYDQTLNNAMAGSKTLRGLIRVSVPVVFGRQFVVPEIKSFARRHRDLEFDLRFGDRYVNLVDDHIDVAVRVGTPTDSSNIGHPLSSTDRHLVAAPSYLRRHPRPTNPRDLKLHDCLVHTDIRQGDLWRLTRDGRSHSVRVRGSFAANNSEAILQMAKAGHGIAMLAAWLVEADLASRKLQPVLPEYCLPPAPIAALTPPGRHIPARVRLLIDHLREAYRRRFQS